MSPIQLLALNNSKSKSSMYIYAATVPQDGPKLILYILIVRNTAFIHGVSFLILVPTQILQSIYCSALQIFEAIINICSVWCHIYRVANCMNTFLVYLCTSMYLEAYFFILYWRISRKNMYAWSFAGGRSGSKGAKKKLRSYLCFYTLYTCAINMYLEPLVKRN